LKIHKSSEFEGSGMIRSPSSKNTFFIAVAYHGNGIIGLGVTHRILG